MTTTHTTNASVCIGFRVRHADGRTGTCTTHYDNGDHMILVGDEYERWTPAECEWAAR